MSNYRILALDGGGIRGVYTAVLLQRLSKEVPGFLGRADLLAGTSTGGILALALAEGAHAGGTCGALCGQRQADFLKVAVAGDRIPRRPDWREVRQRATGESAAREVWQLDAGRPVAAPRAGVLVRSRLASGGGNTADVEAEVLSQFCGERFRRSGKSGGCRSANQRGTDLLPGASGFC